MVDYELQEYKDEYYETLYKIKVKTLRKYIEKCYGWNEDAQREFYRQFIEQKRADIKVIMVNKKAIGLFANFIDDNNEDMIELFCIDNEYQNLGIGTRILRTQLEEDEKRGISTILRVFKENPAQILYKRVGFEIYGETNFHYQMRRKKLHKKNMKKRIKLQEI